MEGRWARGGCGEGVCLRAIGIGVLAGDRPLRLFDYLIWF
jgi:hypothetical protein